MMLYYLHNTANALFNVCTWVFCLYERNKEFDMGAGCGISQKVYLRQDDDLLHAQKLVIALVIEALTFHAIDFYELYCSKNDTVCH